MQNKQKSFREIDVVVVRRLLVPTRSFDGSESVMRQPVIGDTGTIVHAYDHENFIVEYVDESGRTVWLADFHADELAFLPEDWSYDVTEISVGVYSATGIGPSNMFVSITDTDPRLALAACIEFSLRHSPERE